MKTKCSVYQYYKNDRPIGYCFLDLHDVTRMTISYSTYRRLSRLCQPGVTFYIVAPVCDEYICEVEGSEFVGHRYIYVKPFPDSFLTVS